jgi:RnfABCDGE-type electron transport complex B subunit
MDFTIVMLAGGTMLGLGVAAGFLLGWANRVFHVPVDPRIEAVSAVLPGANCGGCGCTGCALYAEAVVAGKIEPNKCTVGGASCAEAIAEILGVKVQQTWPYRPVVHCRAHIGDKHGVGDYRGEKTCGAANLLSGVQGCAYGCLALGDCVAACEFDAIHVINGLATVDYVTCVGCGACARACPRNIITMVPFKRERMMVIACSNKDFGRDVRAVCKVGCLGCMACSKASGLFVVKNNLAQIDYDKYNPDDLGSANIALEKCPAQGIVYIGKPMPEDAAKVAHHADPKLVEADFKTTVDRTEWQG